MENQIQIIGIFIGALVAIGVAIYQVKASKVKSVKRRESQCHQDIWDSLNEMRVYFENGMQSELDEIGTLKSEPIHKFKNVVTKSKTNIEISLFNDLYGLYEKIAIATNESIFEPMKIFFLDKDNYSSNELKKIEKKVNHDRIKIMKKIEKFMKKHKNKLS